jgi:hypothetical protein
MNHVTTYIFQSSVPGVTPTCWDSVPYGGGSVMVWGCISHDCKLDLVSIQGNLTGDQYIRDVLQPVVVPYFDKHPLATRPVYMDDNARPPRSRAVTAYLQKRSRDFCSLANHEPGFQNVTYESLDDIYCSKFSTGCNPHVLGWRPHPCVSSLQLDVGCPVLIAAAIPDAMLLTYHLSFQKNMGVLNFFLCVYVSPRI